MELWFSMDLSLLMSSDFIHEPLLSNIQSMMMSFTQHAVSGLKTATSTENVVLLDHVKVICVQLDVSVNF